MSIPISVSMFGQKFNFQGHKRSVKIIDIIDDDDFSSELRQRLIGLTITTVLTGEEILSGDPRFVELTGPDSQICFTTEIVSVLRMAGFEEEAMDVENRFPGTMTILNPGSFESISEGGI
jgi:hypothetical protein